MKLFGFSRSWLGLHVEVKSWTLRRGEALWSQWTVELLVRRWLSLHKGVCIQFVKVNYGVWCALRKFGWTVLRHIDWREPISWRVSIDSWWVLLEVWVEFHEVAEWKTRSLVGSYGISLQLEWWKDMYGAFRLDSWAEVESLQLILEFGESCRWQRQTQFGSGEISGNQL